MKKTILLLLFFAPTIFFAQGPPIKYCQTSDCDKNALKDLLLVAEHDLYEEQGFSYNDSIFFEVEAKKDSIVFKNNYAWVSKQTLSFYQQVLSKHIDYDRLERNKTYSVYWTQEPVYPDTNTPELSEIERVPQAFAAKGFNAKGKKAVYQYYYSAYLENKLKEWNFNDEERIEANFIFSQGKLTRVNFIYPPLSDKRGLDLAIFAKAIEANLIENTLIPEREAYTLKFKSRFTALSPDRERKNFLKNQMRFFIDNKLWRPLKAFIAEGNNSEGELIVIDTSGNRNNHYVWQKLEEALKNEEISKRWWKVIPTAEDAENSSNKKIENKDLRPPPVYSGCDPNDSLEDLYGCFQNKMLNHISENFEYPEDMLDAGVQGKVIISFTIEKDGTITSIVVPRGVTEKLDIEGIRVISEIPNMKQAAFDGEKFVRMSFTLPINLKLQ